MRTIHYAVLNEISSSPSTPRTILDIGCGDGQFTQVVCSKFPSSKIIGIDTSLSRIFSGGNIKFINGSVEHLPFEKESFDLVFTVLSLHHWKEKDKGISEIYRVLKKDGRIIIGDPLLEDWMSNRVLGFLMQKSDGGVFSDKKELSGYLARAGFKNISISLVPYTMKSLYLITAEK